MVCAGEAPAVPSVVRAVAWSHRLRCAGPLPPKRRRYNSATASAGDGSNRGDQDCNTDAGHPPALRLAALSSAWLARAYRSQPGAERPLGLVQVGVRGTPA